MAPILTTALELVQGEREHADISEGTEKPPSPLHQSNAHMQAIDTSY